MSNKLSSFGAKTIEIAVIEFGEPQSWDAMDLALAVLNRYDWLIFASANAVEAVRSRSITLGVNLSSTKAKIAAIGSATARALADRGMIVSFKPTSFVAERFVAEFAEQHQVSQQRILWPRTNVGKTLIADRLKELGAIVDTVEAYSTNLPVDAETVANRLFKLFLDHEIDVVTLASSQTAKNFFELLKTGYATTAGAEPNLDKEIGKILENVLIAAIGPVTAETVRSLFGRVDIEAGDHTSEGLVVSLVKHFAK